MTDQFDPADLRALLDDDAATPGSWRIKHIAGWPVIHHEGRDVAKVYHVADARLIVYLRNHAAEFLDERERLQSALDRAMTAMEVSNAEALRAEEKAAELRDGMAQALDACEEAQGQRDDALAKVAELERLVDETHPSKLNIKFEGGAPECEPCQQFPRAKTWAEKLKHICPTAVQVASDYEEEVQELAKELAASRQRAEALLPWDDSRCTTTGRVAVALQAVALARTTDERDEARAEVARLKAELEDARDALDAARALIEDPENTPLDEAAEESRCE